MLNGAKYLCIPSYALIDVTPQNEQTVSQSLQVIKELAKRDGVGRVTLKKSQCRRDPVEVI